MKFYAIGLVKSAISDHAIEGCGTFNCVMIDGRLSFEKAKTLANDWYEKKHKTENMIGYRLFKAERISQCKKPLFIHNPSNLPIKD